MRRGTWLGAEIDKKESGMKYASTKQTSELSQTTHSPVSVLESKIGEHLLSLGLCVSSIDLRQSKRLGDALLVSVVLYRSECLNALHVVEHSLEQKLSELRRWPDVHFFWRYVPRSTKQI
jgi:hypothetical protein